MTAKCIKPPILSSTFPLRTRLKASFSWIINNLQASHSTLKVKYFLLSLSFISEVDASVGDRKFCGDDFFLYIAIILPAVNSWWQIKSRKKWGNNQTATSNMKFLKSIFTVMTCRDGDAWYNIAQVNYRHARFLSIKFTDPLFNHFFKSQHL